MKTCKTVPFAFQPTLQDLIYVAAVNGIPETAVVEIEHGTIVVFWWERK